jgi:hypothetical protein
MQRLHLVSGSPARAFPAAEVRIGIASTGQWAQVLVDVDADIDYDAGVVHVFTDGYHLLTAPIAQTVVTWQRPPAGWTAPLAAPTAHAAPPPVGGA